MKVLAIAGSLRTDSTNAALVRAIAHLAPPETTVKIYAGLSHLPPFSPDVDTDSPALPVADLRECIKTANAVIICTPEYAYGMPGSLKNALDWLVSSAELYGKPVAALSASPSERGGDRALTWLLQTLSALGAEVPNGASFAVPFVPKKLQKNLAGDRLADPETAAQVYTLFESLAAAAKTAIHRCPPLP